MAVVADRGTGLVEEMLSLAYELLREGWCQGSPAVDACDRPVAPTSAFACKWSAPGALERVWARHDDRFGHALEAFERANLALASVTGGLSPQAWNDAENRTLPDVLDAVAEAIDSVVTPPTTEASPPKSP